MYEFSKKGFKRKGVLVIVVIITANDAVIKTPY